MVQRRPMSFSCENLRMTQNWTWTFWQENYRGVARGLGACWAPQWEAQPPNEMKWHFIQGSMESRQFESWSDAPTPLMPLILKSLAAPLETVKVFSFEGGCGGITAKSQSPGPIPLSFYATGPKLQQPLTILNHVPPGVPPINSVVKCR